MISYDELGKLLDEIADELPEDLYRELNGGMVLLPDIKLHPESNETDNLYILGQYHNQPLGLGRYITIYYGSLMRVYPNHSPASLKEELRKVVFHEFFHHLESLAGERSLEIKDAEDLAKYKLRFSMNKEQKNRRDD